jgi:hypothetical protein
MSLTLSGDSPKISADGTGVITSGTAKTASGTSVDFTGIPSWVKRITVMFSGVSTNGASSYLIRLGTSGGISSSGYISTRGQINGTAASSESRTDGFVITAGTASTFQHGSIVLSNVSGNTWTSFGVINFEGTVISYSSGSRTLGGTLDRVRITTVNGTDTFDAGSINILYE